MKTIIKHIKDNHKFIKNNKSHCLYFKITRHYPYLLQEGLWHNKTSKYRFENKVHHYCFLLRNKQHHFFNKLYLPVNENT
jgi:hypothetical protein